MFNHSIRHFEHILQRRSIPVHDHYITWNCLFIVSLIMILSTTTSSTFNSEWSYPFISVRCVYNMPTRVAGISINCSTTIIHPPFLNLFYEFIISFLNVFFLHTSISYCLFLNSGIQSSIKEGTKMPYLPFSKYGCQLTYLLQQSKLIGIP